MNILFKGGLILLSFSSLFAVSLKDLIKGTIENNENLKSNKYQAQAKRKIFESVKNQYNPSIIIGVNYSKLDLDVRNVQVGATTAGFIKMSATLYDGGKNKSIYNQKKYEYEAQKLNNITDIKQTVLNVVTLYFNLKTINENIKVFKEKGIALKAQYERVKTKYNMKMATIDEVLKLKSEYESNLYTIDELKYQKEEILSTLKLLSGIEIDSLDTNKLPDIKGLNYKESSSIKALSNTLKSNEENVKVVNSIKKPQIKVEDILSIYDYSDYNEKLLTDLPDKQNQFILSVTYNIFDTSSKSKIESAKLSKNAIFEKLRFEKKQEKQDFILAKKKLNTQLLKLKSLKSAVDMANSVYDIIKAKYENGIVDNITYLDALSKKIYNLALYQQALNNLEIAKANYYFKSGIDYKKVLKEW